MLGTTQLIRSCSHPNAYSEGLYNMRVHPLSGSLMHRFKRLTFMTGISGHAIFIFIFYGFYTFYNWSICSHPSGLDRSQRDAYNPGYVSPMLPKFSFVFYFHSFFSLHGSASSVTFWNKFAWALTTELWQTWTKATDFSWPLLNLICFCWVWVKWSTWLFYYAFWAKIWEWNDRRRSTAEGPVQGSAGTCRTTDLC